MQALMAFHGLRRMPVDKNLMSAEMALTLAMLENKKAIDAERVLKAKSVA